MKPLAKDFDQTIQEVASVTRLCLSLIDSRLELERPLKLKAFAELKNQARDARRLDPESVLLGFQACWNREDYLAIVEIGGTLPSDWLDLHPELAAYIAFAKQKLGAAANG